MKKYIITALTIATLALTSCSSHTYYRTKNDNGTDLRIELKTNFQQINRNGKDTIIGIYNENTNNHIKYINNASSPFVVDEIRMYTRKNTENLRWKKEIYSRGGEGTERMFEEADCNFRKTIKFTESEDKKNLEEKMKTASEVLTK
jgi:hypothetical protein